MWDRGRVELTALGAEPVSWLQGWKCRINRGDAVAFGDHAILGWDWEDEYTCNTSFQASRSFEEPGVGSRVTKEIRRAIPRLMVETGARLVVTYSLCVDPEAPKWFRLLGLIENTDYKGPQMGPYTMRQFLRRS